MAPERQTAPHFSEIIAFDAPVLLFGAAPVEPRIAEALSHIAPHIVAADGGAREALAHGLVPSHVWGDFDSLDAETRARLPEGSLHLIAEQETTDFEKALSRITAPLVLCAGVTGARRDHELAAYNTLVRQASQLVVLVSEQDIISVAPPQLRLATLPGERVSLFPMAPVQVSAEGLRWPLEALDLAPDGRIGTSNAATGTEICLDVSAPGLLLILPREALPRVSAALVTAPRWPRP